jgi:hypothetical protein
LLDTLPDKLRHNVLRGAARAGANVVAAEAKIRGSGLTVPDGWGAEGGKSVTDQIKVVDSSRGGLIKAKIQLKGPFASVGIWAEYGTLPHLIRVRDEDRPVSNTRRGPRRWSITTINAAVRRGSLIIGKNFIGQLVHHPGAKAIPFLRTSADVRQNDAVAAAAEYVRARIEKEGLDMPDTTPVEEEE